MLPGLPRRGIIRGASIQDLLSGRLLFAQNWLLPSSSQFRLIQAERRVVDQLAARLGAVERQGLNHLGGTALDS